MPWTDELFSLSRGRGRGEGGRLILNFMKTNRSHLMKMYFFAALLMAAALLTPALAQNYPNLPPPVYEAPPAPAPRQVYVYDQKPLPGMPALITPEQAQSIVDQFSSN